MTTPTIEHQEPTMATDTVDKRRQLLQRLHDDRTLTAQDRANLLADDADPDLLRDLAVERLSWLERQLILTLDLPWEEGPSCWDLGYVLKSRAKLRANPRPGDDGDQRGDVLTRLESLRAKGWVRSARRADGRDGWQLVEQ